jgi:two-component system CheB/CheR fusion protein
MEKEVAGVLVTFFDITTLTAAERQKTILIDELNHRVRNMLTIVIAIAQQTIRYSTSKENFYEAFSGRVRGMSVAYAVVSRQNWGTVTLFDVINSHLLPYLSDDAERIKMEGPEVQCEPTAALALGMVIHELATNAVKYGALLAPGGKLIVKWEVTGGSPPSLLLNWSEEGGPPMTAPYKKGFGMQLVERELNHALSATVEFQSREQGLLAIARIPLDPTLFHLP